MLKSYFEELEYENLKNSNDILYKTLELVLKVFDERVDKGGLPYFNHLFKVYGGVSSYDEKIVALLHDIVEDTNITFDDLEKFGYDNNIIDALKVLTKNKGEYYYEHNLETLLLKHAFAYSMKEHVDSVFPTIKAALIHLTVMGN